jgi:hypothetical protein
MFATADFGLDGCSVFGADATGRAVAAAGGGGFADATAGFGLAGGTVFGADAIGRAATAAAGGAFTDATAGFGRVAGGLLSFPGSDGLVF